MTLDDPRYHENPFVNPLIIIYQTERELIISIHFCPFNRSTKNAKSYDLAQVSTTAPRFGKFQQTFSSNRNNAASTTGSGGNAKGAKGAKGTKGAKDAKGAKGAGRGNKVRQEPRGSSGGPGEKVKKNWMMMMMMMMMMVFPFSASFFLLAP